MVSSGFRFVRFDHHRDDLVQVADDPVMRHGENRRRRIRVDRDDLLAFRHAGAVLHGAADAAGDVEFRTHGHARLADLVVVVDPAGVDGRAGGADLSAERLGELVDELEVRGGADAVAAGDDDLRALQVHGLLLADAFDDLHDHLLRGQGRGDAGDRAGAGRVGFAHLHHALADGDHLRIFPGVHDGGDDVAAERGTDLHEFILVVLPVDFVVEIVDAEVGAVGGQAGELFRGHARGQFAALHGSAEHEDVRAVFADEVDDDLGERQDGERLQARVFCEEDVVAAVLEERGAAVFHAVSEEERLDLDAEPVGEFTAFADEFQAHVGDLAAFLFDENPDVSDSGIFHCAHPRV